MYGFERGFGACHMGGGSAGRGAEKFHGREAKGEPIVAEEEGGSLGTRCRSLIDDTLIHLLAPPRKIDAAVNSVRTYLAANSGSACNKRPPSRAGKLIAPNEPVETRENPRKRKGRGETGSNLNT